jgi:hypothetical protein
LDLFDPEDLWWWIREEERQAQDIAPSSVSAQSQPHPLRSGRYRSHLAGKTPLYAFGNLPARPTFLVAISPKTFLTISLSEPFDGFLYKLVAGVVCLPASSQ